MAKESAERQEQLLHDAQLIDWHLDRIQALVRAVERSFSELARAKIGLVSESVKTDDLPLMTVLQDEVANAQTSCEDLLRTLGEPKTEPTTEEKND